MRYQLPGFFLIFTFLFIGCQGKDSPTAAPVDQVHPQSLEMAGNTEGNPDRYLWGYWHCEANTQDGTVTAIPDRTANLHVNLTALINSQVLLGIEVKTGSDPSIGYFVVDFIITHPFAGMPKLTAFDLHGIILCNGSEDAGSIRFPGSGDLELKNADGFSRWWNPDEFTDPGFFGYVKGQYAIQGPDGPPTSNINPYKLFGDGLMSLTDMTYLTTLPLTSQTGRAVFSSGATNRREYQVQFPWYGGPIYYFDYAVDC
jgi:hypothetical protein